jgi:hypothetical protein
MMSSVSLFPISRSKAPQNKEYFGPRNPARLVYQRVDDGEGFECKEEILP